MVGSFTTRLDDQLLEKLDQMAEEQGMSRQTLISQVLARYTEKPEEEYYTIKAYSDDHQRYADIRYMDGFVSEHSTGFDDSNNDWRILEHARDLVERNQLGDKEEAIKLFQALFGERNVFVKDE